MIPIQAPTGRRSHRAWRTRPKKSSDECCVRECAKPHVDGRRACETHVPFFDRIRVELQQETDGIIDRTIVREIRRAEAM